MNLNEHLAIKVMGWCVAVLTEADREKFNYPENFDMWGVGWVYRTDSYREGINLDGDIIDYGIEANVINGCNFDTNIEQAMMCLDTFRSKGIDITWDEDNEIWRVGIWEDNRTERHGSDKSIPVAISLACARATGYE